MYYAPISGMSYLQYLGVGGGIDLYYKHMQRKRMCMPFETFPTKYGPLREDSNGRLIPLLSQSSAPGMQGGTWLPLIY